jgi:NDP-sugar pyrophosphorylase family protein
MVAKDFFGRLPEKRTFSMEADFFPNYVSQGRMFGMVVEAPFFDIGAPDSYRAFQEFATGENLG